jgi:hypothetical protein
MAQLGGLQIGPQAPGPFKPERGYELPMGKA